MGGGLDPPAGRAASRCSKPASGVCHPRFLNITGQVIQRQILDSYEHESFCLAKLCARSRRAGWRTPAGDHADHGPTRPHRTGDAVPLSRLGEDYIDTPATTKRGLIVPVTREAISSTARICVEPRERSRRSLGFEQGAAPGDIVLGLTQSYKWRGTSYNTFATRARIGSINRQQRARRLDERRCSRGLVRQHARSNDGPADFDPRRSVLVMPALRAHGAARLSRGDNRIHERRDEHDGREPADELSRACERLAYRRQIESGVTESVAKGTWCSRFRAGVAYMEKLADHGHAIDATAKPTSRKTSSCGSTRRANARAAVLNPRYVVKCVPE